MKEKVGVIVTARVKSSRIKNKVLQKIGSKRAIEILLEHVIGYDKHAFQVVLAIPENKDDDILESIGHEMGVEVYRGQDGSPLHRLYNCAKKYKFDHVVRITADDILIDQRLMRIQVKVHINGNNDYTSLTRCPSGIAGEVIRFDALEKAAMENENDVEFVSYYVKKGFKCYDFYPEYEYQVPYRLVMDYPEDLLLLRILFTLLPDDGFRTLDIIHILKNHKYLLRINHLPKLTFYTCCYNSEKYISETIMSVVNQDFDDWEYIIIDDCSTDNSLKTIMELYTSLSYEIQSKIKVLRNDKNIGLPACCNKVVSRARGQFVSRVDSDDTIKKSFAGAMLAELEMDYSKSGVISGYTEIDESGNKIKDVSENKWHPAGCVLKKRSVDELRYMEHLKYCEGEEFFKRFRNKYDVVFIKNSLWNYRQHAEQKTAQKDHPLNVGY